MPIRQEFLKELEVLHKNVIKMGSLIEQSIDETIEALIKQDVSLAQEVIKKDDVIDELEIEIERECIMLIAKQQPIASDLRKIASVMKIITDLERIADHCADISKYTIKLSNEKYIKPLIHIPEMAKQVKEMVRETIDAFISNNIHKANEIREKDDEIDRYFDIIVKELSERMESKPEVVPQCINFIFIVKYLERMADHSTNIAEWVQYIVTGDMDI
ncbi:PhoU-like phosphate uptake regulator [Natranaerovirga hydrolytica]|uniref:Phosphate-specific transport system accessory protein PhoU n=1 Tax=Natranaerovirga hydrolytica TaxID=680378 RepID=A0A4V2Q1T4_9FIRM|nr:phosphate signaling complex protein PhoU [Natranaerovirga hydrolytica]TCK98781.1 PhoU-like phosphate uptake regulator [Natranaerovirga hydrolytica]